MKKLSRRQLRRMLQEERRRALHEASVEEITQKLLQLGPDALEKLKKVLDSMGDAIGMGGYDTGEDSPYYKTRHLGSMGSAGPSPTVEPRDLSESRITRRLLRQMILEQWGSREEAIAHSRKTGDAFIWDPSMADEPEGFDPEMPESVPPEAQRKLDKLLAMDMPARYNPATGMVELLN